MLKMPNIYIQLPGSYCICNFFQIFKLTKADTWDLDFDHGFTMNALSGNTVALRGTSQTEYSIWIMDVDISYRIKEFASECNHQYGCVTEFTPPETGVRYLVESCNRCPKIVFIDYKTGQSFTAYDVVQCMPARVIVLKSARFLVSDLGQDMVRYLQWDGRKKQLVDVGKSPKLNLGVITGMAYAEKEGVLALAAMDKKVVKAIR